MTAPWQPPTEVEQHLLDAKNRGDKDAYLRSLAGADLFVLTRKSEADAVIAGRQTPFELRIRPGFTRSYVDVFTRGGLPTPAAGHVFVMSDMEILFGEPRAVLGRRYLINPGTPVEMRFPMKELARWTRQNSAIIRPDWDAELLATKFDEPLRGPLAQALACGAHLAVANRVAWNSLSTTWNCYINDVEMIRRDWDIWDADDWRQTMDSLLDSDGVSGSELVLSLRNQAASQDGTNVDPLTWRDAVRWWCQDNEVEDDDLPGLLEDVGRILRYEERFRADGVLPTDGYVSSMLGWDYGRAVNMARWGHAARYCDKPTAERLILRAGRLCGKHYGSWTDFSAGYMLGRVLHFDEEEFGDWYTSVLKVHSMLADDPASPWQNLSFIAESK